MRLSYIIISALQAVAFVEGSKWTLHSSCYRDLALQKALITAMETAKSRADNAAKSLSLSKGIFALFSDVRKVAQLLLGSDKYDARADEAIEKLKRIAALEGPIGVPKPSNLLDPQFADHPDWKNLETNDDHFKDFVIYCAPQLGTKTDVWGNTANMDLARDHPLGPGNTLLQMRDETASGRWQDEKKKALAITIRDEGLGLDPVTFEPRGDRRQIAETITFHPLWIQEIAPHGYELISDTRLKDASQNNALQIFRERGLPPPVESLMGLEGTLYHETFHLSAFGGMKDLETDAYGWANNVRVQSLDNPETLALLALIVDLASKKYITDKDGKVDGP